MQDDDRSTVTEVPGEAAAETIAGLGPENDCAMSAEVEAEEDAAQGFLSLETLTKRVKMIQTLVLTTGALIFTLYVGGYVAVELSRNGLRIEPIEAPDALVSRGFSQIVLGQELFQGVLKVRNSALTAKEMQYLAPGWEETEFHVPGTKMSIESVVRFLKWYETRILGAVTEESDGRLRMRLRTQGGAINLPEDHEITAAAIDQLIDKGAEAILLATDPFILAAHLYFQEHDRPATCTVLRRVLSNDDPTDDAWALNLWGLLLDDYGFHEEAVQMYNQSIEANPNMVQPMNNWALSILRRKNLDDVNASRAEEMLENVLATAPDYPQAHINLVALRARQAIEHTEGSADLSEFLDTLDFAISLDPRSPLGYFSKAQILMAQGTPNEALSEIVRAIDARPDYAPAYTVLGNYYSAQNEPDQAAKMFKRAISIDRDLASAWAAWGYHDVARDPVGGVAKLHAAFTLNPELRSESASQLIDALGAIDDSARHFRVELDLFGCPTIIE